MPVGSRVAWIERDPGKLARALSLLNTSLVAIVGDSLGRDLGAATIVPQAGRDVVRDLGWLRELTERRKSFSAVAHCLCMP
jgi:hypothetical protein